MAMSEKELMVEAIMALRGYNTRLIIIEEQQNDLYDRVATLESGISSLESDVSSIKSSRNTYRKKDSQKTIGCYGILT